MKLLKRSTLREKAERAEKNANKMYSEVDVAYLSHMNIPHIYKESSICDECIHSDESQEEISTFEKKIKGPQGVSAMFKEFLLNFTQKEGEDSAQSKNVHLTTHETDLEEFMLIEDNLPTLEEMKVKYMDGKLAELSQRQADESIDDDVYSCLLADLFEDERKYTEFYDQHLSIKLAEEYNQKQEDQLLQSNENVFQEEENEGYNYAQHQLDPPSKLEKEVSLFQQEDRHSKENHIQKPNKDTTYMNVESLEGLCQAAQNLKISFASGSEIQVFNCVKNCMIKIDTGKFIDDLLTLSSVNYRREEILKAPKLNGDEETKESNVNLGLQEQTEDLIDLDKELLGDTDEQLENSEENNSGLKEDEHCESFNGKRANDLFESIPVHQKLQIEDGISRRIEEDDKKNTQGDIENVKPSILSNHKSSSQQYIVDHKGRKRLTTVNFSKIPTMKPKNGSSLSRKSTLKSPNLSDLSSFTLESSLHEVEGLLAKSKTLKPDRVQNNLSDMNFGISKDNLSLTPTNKETCNSNKAEVADLSKQGQNKTAKLERKSTQLDAIKEEASSNPDIVTVEDNPKPTTNWEERFAQLNDSFLKEFDETEESLSKNALKDNENEEEKFKDVPLNHYASAVPKKPNPLEPLISEGIDNDDFFGFDIKRVTSMQPLDVQAVLDTRARLEATARTKGNTDLAKLSKRVMKLESKLDKAKNIILEKEESLQLMKKLNIGEISEQDEREVHFAFMFASPLVRNKDGKIIPSILLN